jgi:RNA recognition motif-containing protein
LLRGLFFLRHPAKTPSEQNEDTELKKMYVGNLPVEASEQSVRELFSEYGTVRSIRLASDVFTGRCRGFGFIEMEGHEARAAIAGLDGKLMGEKSLRVRYEEPRSGGGRGRKRR